MRWLFLKDLTILRRSPLLVALLVIYPIVISVLIGFALSAGPDKPKVAFVNEVPASENIINLGGEEVDVSKYADQIFESIDPVRVSSREEALKKVEDGEVLGALIIPADITDKLDSGLGSAQVEVIYNAEDPLKRDLVRNTIKSQVQDANAALTKRFTELAIRDLNTVLQGGTINFPIRGDVDILGLQKSREVLEQARDELPEDSPARPEIERVIQFAGLADFGLDLFPPEKVLAAVGEPIQPKLTEVEGGRTPLDAFAVAIAVTVSLMFVTLLLAAGTLAAEREENAFLRLVRGLVSKTGLLVEKIGLAAFCSLVVTLLMMCGLALFVGLDFGRAGFWVIALAAGALAFGAMGVAIGALTREVRAASLLAFMISLPIAFLAIVPSGAVSPALYDVIRVVSALFPFKPTLAALDAAINDAGSLTTPLLHLAALVAAFSLAARLALRRFV
ncbi:MAG: ABC transporter permease [Thermoleophilaceae bacterium]|nr:ABC transporter permease [Thermoleophilaceae bacterium]